MVRYPQEPKEWEDDQYTLFREFKFRSTPDIEVLMRLVRENIPNRGNDQYLRARLLGILRSQYSTANTRFWIKHYNPKTWWWRFQYSRLKRYVHRKLKTRFYTGQVKLCQIAKEVVDEMESKNVAPKINT